MNELSEKLATKNFQSGDKVGVAANDDILSGSIIGEVDGKPGFFLVELSNGQMIERARSTIAHRITVQAG